MVMATPQARMFSDDGTIPNNPRLPFLIYRGGIGLSGTAYPEEGDRRPSPSMSGAICGVLGIYPMCTIIP